MDLQIFVENSATIISILCGICILVSVITEFTKEIGFLKKIPTDLQVLVLSMIVCIIGFLAFISWKGIPFLWYYLVAIIFASFIVAIITAKGWDYFIEIIKRYWRK